MFGRPRPTLHLFKNTFAEGDVPARFVPVSQTVHLAGQLGIQRAQPVHIMGRQHDIHRLVNIVPFRMVIPFFRPQCRPCHPSEGLDKILEHKCFADRIAARHHCPAGRKQRVQQRARGFLQTVSRSFLFLHFCFLERAIGRQDFDIFLDRRAVRRADTARSHRQTPDRPPNAANGSDGADTPAQACARPAPPPRHVPNRAQSQNRSPDNNTARNAGRGDALCSPSIGQTAHQHR